jgi:hypothetical protein
MSIFNAINTNTVPEYIDNTYGPNAQGSGRQGGNGWVPPPGQGMGPGMPWNPGMPGGGGGPGMGGGKPGAPPVNPPSQSLPANWQIMNRPPSDMTQQLYQQNRPQGKPAGPPGGMSYFDRPRQPPPNYTGGGFHPALPPGAQPITPTNNMSPNPAYTGVKTRPPGINPIQPYNIF